MSQRIAQRIASADGQVARLPQASPLRAGPFAAYKLGARRGRASQRPASDSDLGPDVGGTEDPLAQAERIVEEEFVLWDRKRFIIVEDDVNSRRQMDEIREEWNHLAYMRAMKEQFPNIVEEMSCIYVMAVSTAPLESVLSHAGRVEALRRTRLSCEMHEAMTAAVVRPEDFAEALQGILENWVNRIPWDQGVLQERETSCLDGVRLDEDDEGAELTGEEALHHHPLIDDIIGGDELAEPEAQAAAQFPTIRGEDEAFPRLVPIADA